MEPCTFIICSHHSESNEKAIDYLYHRLIEANFTLDEDNPKLIIILGGDGSFLHSLHEYDFTGDFLLINTGHLGFFSDYELDQLEDCVNDIINKEETYETVPVYNAVFSNKSHYFISDCTLLSDRTTELSLYVDDQYLTKTRSSGIVISSAVGSTGFIGSLNSPVVLKENLPIYQYSLLAPVCNRLYPNSINKALLSQKQKLFININDGKVTCILDGMKIENDFDEDIIINCSDKIAKLIHFKDSDNFSRIVKAINIEEK